MSDQLREALREALATYRCREHLDEDGDGVPLVDVLTHGGDVGPGKRELEALADHLYDELPDAALAQPVQVEPVGYFILDEGVHFQVESWVTGSFPLYAAAPSLAPDAPDLSAQTVSPLNNPAAPIASAEARAAYMAWADKAAPAAQAGQLEQVSKAESCRMLNALIRAEALPQESLDLLRSLIEPHGAAQAGKWVPREPTAYMEMAGKDELPQELTSRSQLARKVFVAMCAAAPPQAAPEPAGLLSRLRECLPRVGESENVWCSAQGHDLREAVALLERADLAQPGSTQLRTALDAILNHPPGSAHRIARQALDAQPVATEATPETKGGA